MVINYNKTNPIININAFMAALEDKMGALTAVGERR